MSYLLHYWIHKSRINPVVPNPYEMLIGAIAFLGVLGCASRLVPRLNRALEARTDAIDGTLQRAADVQAEAAQLLEQYQALQAEARHEAAAVRQQAAAQGARYMAERRDEAERAARHMVAGARAQLDAEYQHAYAVLRPDVGELAIDLASRIVGEPLSRT